MSVFYDNIYEHFKLYYGVDDADVERWNPGLGSEIIAYLKNGDIVRFNGADKTISYIDPDRVIDDNMYKSIFGARLKSLMLSRGVSQKVLAEDTGINIAMLSRYVTGRNLPDVRNIKRICQALNCTFEDLTDFD